MTRALKTTTRMFWRSLALLVPVLLIGMLVRADEPQTGTGTWSAAGTIGALPDGAAATVLPAGQLLIAGGTGATGPRALISVFDASAWSWAAAGTLTTARSGAAAATLGDGRVVVAGGTSAAGVTASVEIFDPATGLSASAGHLATARTGAAAAALEDGRVLVVGGSDASGPTASAEIYDPVTGASIALTAGLATARTGASATTVLGGHVVVIGGSDGTTDLASAELFHPEDNSFEALGTVLATGRRNHVALLLPHNNNVLIAGGTSHGQALSSAELYVPAPAAEPFELQAGTFASTGAMASARVGGVASPLPGDGTALVGAGLGLDTAEAYHFATVHTDRTDYPPHAPVTVTGGGWVPGETVTLLFQEVPETHADRQVTAVADATGHISNSDFAPDVHDLGVTLYLTAIGQQSTAQMRFTDAAENTTTTISAPTITFNGDASVTVTVAGSPLTPTGSVELDIFDHLGNPLGNVTKPLSSGAYTFTSSDTSLLHSPDSGQYILQAVYTPDVPASFNTSNGASTLTVNKATSSTTVNCVASETYNGLPWTVCSAQTTGAGGLLVVVPEGSTVSGDGLLHLNYSNNVNAGVSTALAGATFAGDSNHLGGTGNGAFSISPAVVFITASSPTVSYADPVPTITPSFSAFQNGETSGVLTTQPTCTTAYTTASNVGSNPSTSCSGAVAANYVFVYVNGHVTINQVPVVITASSPTVTYGDPVPTITPSFNSGFKNGQTSSVLSTQPTCTTTYTTTSTAGTTPGTSCSGAAATNYSFTYVPGAVTISKAPLTITASSTTVTYGDAVPTITPSFSAFVGTDTAGVVTGNSCSTVYTVTTPVASSPVGTSCSGGTATNYTITYVPGHVTINRAPITITASSTTVTYGDPVPAITPSFSAGFKNGQTSSVLTTQPTCSTTYTPTSAAGTTPPTNCSGAVAANYTFSYVPGTVTISKAPLTITASSTTVTYGAPVPTITPSFSGFVGTDTASAVTGNSCSTVYTPTTPVSSSPVGTSCSGGTATNYTITYVPGTVIINKANANCTVTGYTVVYDGQPHTATGSCTGVAGVDLSAGLNLSGTVHVNVQVYSDHWTFTDGTGNYNNIGPTPVTDTINPVVLTVSPTTSGYSAAVLSCGPSAYWRMSELSGTSLADSGSHGNTVLLPAITFGVTPGAIGASTPGLSMTNGYARLGSSLNLASGPVSFEWWIKPAAQGGDGYGTLLQDNDATSATFSNGIYLVDAGAGKVKVSMWHDNSDHLNNTALTNGTLYHIVAAVDGSGNGTWYVNGVADGTFTYTGLQVNQLFNDYAGEALQTSLVGELAIYPSQLSAGTASTHFGLAGNPSGYSSAVLTDGASTYWKMEELSGPTLTDAGPSAHDATVASVTFGAAPGGSATFGPGLSVTHGYGRLASSIDLSSGPVSFEWWITPSAQGGDGYGTLLQDNDASSATFSNGIFIVDAAPGTVLLSMWHDNSDHFNNTPLTTGTLYHVVAAVDGSGNGTWYVNGVADGTFTYTGLHVNQLFTDYANETLQAPYVDEISICPTTLSAADAANHHTLGSVPVGSTTITYGDPAPPFSPLITGFVNSESAANLTTQPTCSTSYTTGNPVSGSPYPVTCVGGTAINYTFVYNPGTLTVNPKPLTITANDESKTFGTTFTPDGTTQFTHGALVGSDTVTSVTLTSSGYPSGATVAGSPYAIVPSAAVGTGLANYAITYVNGHLTIVAPAVHLTKSVDLATAAPGATLTYTLAYNNTGTAAATGVVITDVVPANTSFVSATGGGSLAAGTVTWNIGTVGIGGSGSVQMVVTVSPSFLSGTITNAAVMSTPNDPNCTSTPSTPCAPPPVTTTITSPILHLTKSVDKATAKPGDTLTYTLAYSNTGTASATSVTITDNVPANTSFVSASGGGSLSAGIVTWTIGTVAAGGSGSVTMVVTVSPSFLSGTITNAAVLHGTGDPNCTATAGTPCSPPPVTTTITSPILHLTKSVSPLGSVAPGATLTYTLAYSNTGTASSIGVVIMDGVPANTTFVSTTGGGVNNAGTVTWNIGTVTAGGSGSVTLTVTVNASFLSGTITNSAVLTGPGDPNCTLTPSTSCAPPPVTTTVVSPILHLTKSVNLSATTPGGTLIYTLGYSNTGTTQATGVVITDAVPANTTFVSATGGGSLSAGTVTWNIGTVAAGGSGSVTMSVTVNNSFLTGTITNSAVLTNASCTVSGATCTPPPVTTTITSPQPTSCSTNNYPYVDANHPLANTAFNESTVLKYFQHKGSGTNNDTIRMWYNDEHALSLGVSQVQVHTGSGTVSTNYTVSAMPNPAVPGSAIPPVVGALALTGDQAGTDPSFRPVYPAVFITDLSVNPLNAQGAGVGDWQMGGTATTPSAVYGTWKSATRLLDKTTNPNTVTLTPGTDPTKNNWSLGAGADAVPSVPAAQNEGYGAEVTWKISDLRLNGNPLDPTHTYRIQFMVHDGDQNKSGGDAGEGCLNITPGFDNVDPIGATDDSYSTKTNTTLTVTAANGVLANDVDPSSLAMTVQQVNGSAANVGISIATTHGHVTVNANGSFTYIPTVGFGGPGQTDSFTYVATDSSGAVGSATVTIKVG